MLESQVVLNDCLGCFLYYAYYVALTKNGKDNWEQYRKKMGMTQQKLAEKMYIDKRTISAYEKDKIDIKVSALKELASILEVTAGYLIDGEMEEIEADVLQLKILIGSLNPDLRKVAMKQLRILGELQLVNKYKKK